MNRLISLLPLATGLLVVAACGGGTAAAPEVATLASDPPAGATASPTTGPADPQQAMLDYAQCMRDHDIDMPDPQVSNDGTGRVFVQQRSGAGDGEDQGPAFDPESPEFQAAQEACDDLIPEGAGQIDPYQEAEQQAQLLAFTQCMRDHGIDMPDPEFSGGNGGPSTVRIGGPDSEIDVESDEFQAAQEACQDLMPGPGESPATSAEDQ